MNRTRDPSVALATGHLKGDLARRVYSGGVLAVGSHIVRTLMHMIGIAIMARLIPPSDFGLVAMATTVTAFAALFTDFGLGAATVQRQDVDQATASGIFFANVAAGLLAMCAIWLVAPLVASFYGDQRIEPALHVLSVMFPITACGAQHIAILTRGMRWLQMQTVLIAGQFVGLACGISMEIWLNLGFWALLVMSITTASVSTMFAWLLCPWRPSLTWDWPKTRSALSFGANLTAFNLINYFHRNFDNVLIGWRLGAVELGYYSRAYALLLLPSQLINGPLASAVVPALSRLQDDRERWAGSYREVFGAVILVAYGIASALVVAGDLFIALLLGPGWERSGRIFTLLATSLFATTPLGVAGWIYISLGRTARMLKWGVCFVSAVVAGFAIAVQFGAEAVALSYTLVTMTALIPSLAFAVAGTPLRLRHLCWMVGLALMAAATAVSAGLLQQHYLGQANVLARFFATVAFTIVAYGAMVSLLLCCSDTLAPLRSRTVDMLRKAFHR